MRLDNISISLPPGYAKSLDEESSRYGFNRSEFIRILFDAYLTATVEMIYDGKREPTVDATTKLPDFFPEILPHRKEEATEWLNGYLRLVIRIQKEREELKKTTGSVDADTVFAPPDHKMSKQENAA